MNKAIISGRLTRDPDVRYTTTGKVVCSLRWQLTGLLPIRTGRKKPTLSTSLYGAKLQNYAEIALQKGTGRW